MDKEYWKSYYEKHGQPFQPSPFCLFALDNYLEKGDSIIDLGCGNGRDSVKMAEEGLRVVGVDQCCTVIDSLNAKQIPDATFIGCGFESMPSHLKIKHAYSRFSLHSIPEHVEDVLLAWVSTHLEDGYFLIETRTDKDDLAGKETDHYRRFLSAENLVCKMIRCGFEIAYMEHARGFSRYDSTFGVDYNSDDPYLLRVVSKLKTKAGRGGF